jgi:hypothetical protein
MAGGDGARKLSRTVRRPPDQTDPLSLAAQKQWPRQPGIDHRTKMERLATILLPNSVAAHDTERDVTDGPAKILKENKTAQNGPSPGETAVTEFRVRCFRPPGRVSARPRTHECRGAVFSGGAGHRRTDPACQRNSGGSLTRRGERLDVSTMASRSATPLRAPEHSP